MDIKVVHNCDQQILSEQILEEESVVTHIYREAYPTEEYDIIKSRRVITEIISVKSLDGNIEYAEEDYEKHLSNKIRWNILPSMQYVVKYKYLKTDKKTYSIEECPRCRAQGWYGDVMNANKRDMEKTFGIKGVSQYFMKLLLTSKGTNRHDLSYGTRLKSLVGTNMNLEEMIEEIPVAVKDAENQVKNYQAESEIDLADDEILDKVVIGSIERDDANQIYVSMSLVSLSGHESNIAFNLQRS